MSYFLEHLLASFLSPAELFGHFTYFLLIVSMLMRRIVWLRALAVTAGIAKIFYRLVLVPDPVSVFWEVIFVAVNVGQLLIIWYYDKHHRFGEDERLFVSVMPADVERRAIKRLLRISNIVNFDRGEELTVEGEPVGNLMYIANGVVTIEKGGKVVAACGPGDYVGEMSFLSGNVASATVRATKPVRVLSFDQEKLRAAVGADAGIRRAMESSMNRNLVGKLRRTSG